MLLKNELILGSLAARLYDDVIIYVVTAEPIKSKSFTIYIYSDRFRQHSPTSFIHPPPPHTHTHFSKSQTAF